MLPVPGEVVVDASKQYDIIESHEHCPLDPVESRSTIESIVSTRASSHNQRTGEIFGKPRVYDAVLYHMQACLGTNDATKTRIQVQKPSSTPKGERKTSRMILRKSGL